MADPRLPEGFGASPDPFRGNPFKKGDPRHRVWEDSTRTAETAVHQFAAHHLEVFPIDSVDQPLWHVDHLSPKFDIWAERYFAVIWSDKAALDFDRWLFNYANSWLQDLTSEPGLCPTVYVLPMLRARLAGRVEHWKAEARRYLAEQREHHDGLTNAEVLDKEVAERASARARSSADTESSSERVFAQRSDGRWEIAFGSRRNLSWGYPRGHGRYLLGMELIHAVLRQPGQPVQVEVPPGKQPDGDQLIDATAMRAFRKELQSIKEARAEAELLGDTERIAELEEKARQIGDYIQQSTTPRGHSKRFSSDKTLAKKRASERYRLALRRLQRDFPELVQHLRKHLKYEMGAFVYTSDDPAIKWRT